MVEILMNIAAISPIFGILVVIIFYLLSKEKSYKQELKDEREKCAEQIQELNDELRDTEKDNLLMISKLADSLDNIASSNKGVHQEIKNLKEFIQLKLDSLKK